MTQIIDWIKFYPEAILLLAIASLFGIWRIRQYSGTTSTEELEVLKKIKDKLTHSLLLEKDSFLKEAERLHDIYNKIKTI